MKTQNIAETTDRLSTIFLCVLKGLGYYFEIDLKQIKSIVEFDLISYKYFSRVTRRIDKF